MSQPPPLDPALLARLAEGLAGPDAQALLRALPAPWAEVLAGLPSVPQADAPRYLQDAARRLSGGLDPGALFAQLAGALGPAVGSLGQSLRALEGATLQQQAAHQELRAALAERPPSLDDELARAWEQGLEVLAEAQAHAPHLAALLRDGRRLGRSLRELLDGLQRPNAHKAPATSAKARQLQRQAERLVAHAQQASPAGLLRRLLPLVEAWCEQAEAPQDRATLLGLRAALWEVAARLGELQHPDQLPRAWEQALDAADAAGDEEAYALATRRSQAEALDAQDWDRLAALARRHLARFPATSATPTERLVELALSLAKADAAQAEALLVMAEQHAQTQEARERAGLALAQLEDERGRTEEAERRWEALQAQAHGARPRTEAHAWQGLAGVCAQRGQWAVAAERYERAWGLAREAPDFVLFVRAALGWVFALDALGQRAQAVEALVASRAFVERHAGAQLGAAMEEAKDELCRRWGDAAFIAEIEALRARMGEARSAPSEGG